MVPVTVRFPNDLADKLVQTSKETGLTVSALIIQACLNTAFEVD